MFDIIQTQFLDLYCTEHPSVYSCITLTSAKRFMGVKQSPNILLSFSGQCMYDKTDHVVRLD